MNTPTVVVSLLLASGAATAITLFGRPATQETPPDPSVAVAKQEIAALREQVNALQNKLELVQSAASSTAKAPARVEVPVLSGEQVAHAVEAYLKQRGGAAGAGAVGASMDGARVPLAELYGDLAGTNFWQNSDLWKKAHAEGRMDELIAQFEADANANPKDPAKQMAVANAYLAYLQLDQSKWPLSMKADEAFDRVLGIDDHHWEARFSKALSYTFYPDFLGKKKDAISNFETLVAQQEQSPVRDSQAQTYLYLGNLLEAKDPAKAKEMWERGVRRHPQNAELLQKLGR